MKVSAGTDATRVASYNPWVSLSWMVTGKTVGGTRLYPARNCLDRETALRMWTCLLYTSFRNRCRCS